MKISGAVDTRKWSAKWRNWNISDIFFLFEFSREAKAAEAARNICVGDNAIGESMSRKWFSRSKEDRFDISDTPHQEDLRGLMII